MSWNIWSRLRAEPRMRKKIIYSILAVCFIGLLPLFLLDFNGLTLVIGQTDSGDMECVLLLVILLTLLAWGDLAIAEATKGWERRIALTFALVVEGIFLAAGLFLMALLDRNPCYEFLPAPEGRPVLVAREESWLLGGWGSFYWQVFPGVLQSTNIAYTTDDGFRPFAHGYYELEWEEDCVTVRFSIAAGWDSRTVPLP